MNKTSMFFLFMLLSSFLFAQNKIEYKITGLLPDDIYDDTYVYLSDTVSLDNPSIIYLDSAKIEGNRFTFKGVTNEKPSLHVITFSDNSVMGGWVVLESGDIYMDFHESGLLGSVSGTPINNQLNEQVIGAMNTLHKKSMLLAALNNSIASKNDSLKLKIREAGVELHTFMNDVYYPQLINFIKNNVEYPVGEFFLLQLGFLRDEDQAVIYPKLSERTKKKLNLITQAAKEEVSQRKKYEENIPESSKIGKPYIDIKTKDLNDKAFKLSNIIGTKKLIMLDFWASWCMPCLKEMPNIAKIYEKHKENGFEIIGISLDKNQSSWKNAISKNNMIWTHIIENKGWESDVMISYGIKSIPYIILIDENGVIVSRNLRGEKLASEIEKILSEK